MQKMILKLKHTPLMSKVMSRPLAVAAVAEVDNNLHVAAEVVNSLEVEELRVEMVREAGG